MVGSEIKNLVNNEEFTLPSNARSIMIEVVHDGSNPGAITVETSHNGTTWHQVGQPIAHTATEPVLTSYDDGSENFLQKVRVSGIIGTVKVNLYFGRSK
jgi:hypothetical protein